MAGAIAVATPIVTGEKLRLSCCEGELTMSDGKTSNRVAVITGGGGALGRGVAKNAPERGYQVANIDNAPRPPAGSEALPWPKTPAGHPAGVPPPRRPV